MPLDNLKKQSYAVFELINASNIQTISSIDFINYLNCAIIFMQTESNDFLMILFESGGLPVIGEYMNMNIEIQNNFIYFQIQ